MNWYLQVLKNYAKFDGRARRTEFWMFLLFNLLFYMAAYILDWLLGTYAVFAGLYGLFTLIPGLAVMVRRLQDTGKEWYYIFLGLIPGVGAIILLIFAAMDGNRGSNKFGPDPKA